VRVPLASASPLLAAILWVVALLVDPGLLAPWSVLMVGLGLLTMATIAVVGMIVVGGRWARRTGLATVGAGLVIAVIRPTDPIWFAALAGSIIAGVLLFHPSVTTNIRKLPAATGPPTRAVVVTLMLAATPFAIGLAAWDQEQLVTVVVGLSAPVAALWYSRVLPGGLFAVRVAWPALALGLAVFQPAAVLVASLVIGAAVLVLAWHREVKVAFYPPRETGRAFPIPPELAPKEVLDAAEIDERGRPR
jgi:hypothetical protein